MSEPSAAAQPSIAVVGGGFGGAIFTINLVRAVQAPIHVDVIEPRPHVGQGLAYGSASGEHRMNTLSANLKVFPDDPMHFERWLRATGHFDKDPDAVANGDQHYARRRVFGAYMAELFQDEARSNSSGSTIRHIRAKAVDVERTPSGLTLTLDDGRRLSYGFVVMCTSFDPPRWWWPSLATEDHVPGLVRDPWAAGALDGISSTARVLIIGTALTMADMVVSLRHRGHRGTITATSRHALLSQTQLDYHEGYDLLAGEKPPATALALLRLMRQRAREAELQNMSWRVAADGLRPIVGSIWQALPSSERAKVVRHLRSYWDIHRFRTSPQVAAIVEAGRRDGWLTVQAGRVVDVRRVDGEFEIESHHGASTRRDRADVVINCTGPSTDIAQSTNPMIKSLVRSGLARPDALRLGFDLDAQSRLVDSNGEANSDIWAVGPLSRPLFGEVIGIPQTSTHARSVAQLVARAVQQALVSPVAG